MSHVCPTWPVSSHNFGGDYAIPQRKLWGDASPVPNGLTPLVLQLAFRYVVDLISLPGCLSKQFTKHYYHKLNERKTKVTLMQCSAYIQWLSVLTVSHPRLNVQFRDKSGSIRDTGRHSGTVPAISGWLAFGNPIYLHSFSRCCLPPKSAKSREIPPKFELIAVQGHFGANRKQVCNFLLFINSN